MQKVPTLHPPVRNLWIVALCIQQFNAKLTSMTASFLRIFCLPTTRKPQLKLNFSVPQNGFFIFP